jgi:hypothetical protein
MARDLASVLHVVPGRESELRAVLAGLPQGDASPFARVSGTHFARWVVAPLRSRRGGYLAGGGTCLVLAAEFDHESAATYLEDLLVRAPDETDAVLAHCSGYPGRRLQACIDWILGARVVAGFSENALPGVLVSEVLDALEVRRRVRDFALRAEGLEGPALKAAWHELMTGR